MHAHKGRREEARGGGIIVKEKDKEEGAVSTECHKLRLLLYSHTL